MNTKVKIYIRWALFALTALMVLGFPLYHIYSYGKVIRLGTTYRLKCEPYDPYDPFSGRYVAINPSVNYPEGTQLYLDNQWAKISKDEKGLLKVDWVTETRPIEGDYLPVCFEDSLQRFYMNEKLAPIADQATRNLRGSTLSCELEIKVLNGRAVSTELYIDNIPIAEYCRKHKQP